MSSPHPDRQWLVDYSSGVLPEERARQVARHLDECTDCDATIRSLESKSDTFVDGLRTPPKDEPLLQEPAYRESVEAAIKLVGPAGAKPQPSTTEGKPAQAAQKLGPYLLSAKLGEGGMGAVFKARHEHLGKTVAIKILPKKAMQDAAAVARFRREMLAVGQLHHPNIVIAFDAGEARGVHYLAMEYVSGRDLSTTIKNDGPVPVEKAIAYMLQAAKGLAFAHSKGIVHRDIKPANLLVDEEGTVKILDMGLARLDDGAAADAEANQGLTQTGQVMGTVDYMAPEQAFDTHRADAKADVYSLACTLYRILTGKNAYGGDTVVQKILAHREQPIPSLAKVCPEAPAALDALYRRMMAKQPGDRPSMAEVVKELEGLIAGPQATAAPAPAFVIDVQKPKLAASSATRSGAKPAQAKAKRAVSRGSKPPVKLIAAGLGGFALLAALGVWLIIRDPEGNEVARIKVPEGGGVTMTSDPGVSAAGVSPSDPIQPPVVPESPIGPKSPASAPAFLTAAPSSTSAGDYALWFDGQSRVELPNPEGHDWKTGDCTLECYARSEGSNDDMVLLGSRLRLILEMRGGSHIAFLRNTENKGFVGAHSTFEAGRRFHVAGVHRGNECRLYIDGRLVDKVESPIEGRLQVNVPWVISRSFVGMIDEVRISKIARYDGDFTPPARHEPDADTMALYHFDEGTGDVLRDASGNGFDGKIVGATWVRAGESAGPATGGEFVPLFNGRDLAGWKIHPEDADRWGVVDGVLTGSGSSHLFSERVDFQDFHLRAEARVDSSVSAGVTCREPTGAPDATNRKRALGYLAKINADNSVDERRTGSLYVMEATTHSDGNTVDLSPVKAGEWFTMDVFAEGNRIRILVNGRTMTDYVDPQERFARGAIALQYFAGIGQVEFRKIEIRRLNPVSAGGGANGRGAAPAP